MQLRFSSFAPFENFVGGERKKVRAIAFYAQLLAFYAVLIKHEVPPFAEIKPKNQM
jgi:hypothetical protein